MTNIAYRIFGLDPFFSVSQTGRFKVSFIFYPARNVLNGISSTLKINSGLWVLDRYIDTAVRPGY